MKEVLSSPSVRVRIRYNDVEHEMLEARIQAKIILNRKRRRAKPSCVQGTFREAGVSRDFCGGHTKRTRNLKSLNSNRSKDKNKRHNAEGDAKSAAATRERREKQKKQISEAKTKLLEVNIIIILCFCRYDLH